MKWFKHQSNASMNAKLRRVRLKYGMEGYGLYWYCLELVAQNVEPHKLTFELEHDAEIISADTGIHYELVQEMMIFMVDLGLFDRDGTVITCMKMRKWCDEYITKVLRGLPDVRTNSGQTPDKIPPNRIEQKRIEQNRTNIRALKRAPKDYEPSDELLDALCAETNLGTPAILAHLREMKDHEFRTAKKDWDAVFRNWVRRAVQWSRDGRNQGNAESFESIHARAKQRAGLD